MGLLCASSGEETKKDITGGLDYYVKKRLMKRFIGFCIIDDTIKAQYLQEMDTALLALPTKHFIREFLRTEQLDCLDRKTFPLPTVLMLGASRPEDIRLTANAHRAMLFAARKGDVDAYLAAISDHYAPLLRVYEYGIVFYD